MSPRVAGAALAVLAVLAALAACARVPAARGGGPAPANGDVWITPAQLVQMHLQLTPAGEHEIAATIITSGRVTFDDSRVTHVFSPVSGRIARIAAQLGQRVRRDDPLAVILSPDVGSASADLDKAESDLVAATLEVRRARELVAEGAGSRREFEQAQNAYRRTLAEAIRARDRMRLFRTGSYDRVSQTFTLRAPIAGEVIARGALPGLELQGQYAGGSSVELFTIGELDRVWVLADLYEVDLARVHVGARVTVNVVAYPNRDFVGRVDWVAAALDPATRTARVRCSFENGDRALRPEMYASVSIAVAPNRAFAVPRTAVLQLGDQTIVFVERGRGPDGRTRFERTPVTVDAGRGGEWAPVHHGLEPGDRVVSSGAVQLIGMLRGGTS